MPSFIAGVALKERLLPKVLLVLANSQGQYLAFGYLVDVTLGILLSRISASGLPVKAMPAKPRQNFLAISVLLPFCVVTAQSFESCPCLAGPMQRILVPSQNARPCQGLYCRVLEALYCILQKSCVGEYFLVMYWGNVIGENLAIYWRSVIGEVLLEKCYWTILPLLFDRALLETWIAFCWRNLGGLTEIICFKFYWRYSMSCLQEPCGPTGESQAYTSSTFAVQDFFSCMAHSDISIEQLIFCLKPEHF